MCGEVLAGPVRLLFAVHLHHGGYLRAAQAVAARLYTLYLSSNTDVKKRGDEDNSRAAKYTATIQQKPPASLLIAWEHAMKLRVTARTLFLSQPSPEVSPATPAVVPALVPIPTTKDLIDPLAHTTADARTDTGILARNPLSLEELSKRLQSRIMFLLEVEARCSDKVVDCTDEGDHQSSSWTQNSKESFLATQNLAQDLELVMGNNMSFIMDPRTSIPHIRAVLDNVQSAYAISDLHLLPLQSLSFLLSFHLLQYLSCHHIQSPYLPSFFFIYSCIHHLPTSTSYFASLIPSLIHFRITVLASNRNSGLKALRNSLDHVTEDLGCGVRCAMLLDFPNTIRYVRTYAFLYSVIEWPSLLFNLKPNSIFCPPFFFF